MFWLLTGSLSCEIPKQQFKCYYLISSFLVSLMSILFFTSPSYALSSRDAFSSWSIYKTRDRRSKHCAIFQEKSWRSLKTMSFCEHTCTNSLWEVWCCLSILSKTYIHLNSNIIPRSIYDGRKTFGFTYFFYKVSIFAHQMSEGEPDKHTTVWVCSLTLKRIKNCRLFRNILLQFLFNFGWLNHII